MSSKNVLLVVSIVVSVAGCAGADAADADDEGAASDSFGLRGERPMSGLGWAPGARILTYKPGKLKNKLYGTCIGAIQSSRVATISNVDDVACDTAPNIFRADMPNGAVLLCLEDSLKDSTHTSCAQPDVIEVGAPQATTSVTVTIGSPKESSEEAGGFPWPVCLKDGPTVPSKIAKCMVRHTGYGFDDEEVSFWQTTLATKNANGTWSAYATRDQAPFAVKHKGTAPDGAFLFTFGGSSRFVTQTSKGPQVLKDKGKDDRYWFWEYPAAKGSVIGKKGTVSRRGG